MDDWIEIILVLILGGLEFLWKLGEYFMGPTWGSIAGLWR